jgi:putative endonuclease
VPERIIAVYILTNGWNTVLYTGVTSDLTKRIAEHRAGVNPDSFSSRYRLNKLVYFETTSDIRAAIAREKQIKAGSRKKKVELIEAINPDWNDLSADSPQGI